MYSLFMPILRQIINRYDWDYYTEKDEERGSASEDDNDDDQKIQGPTCFMIQPNQFDGVWNWARRSRAIERSGTFGDHGFVFVYPGEEYMHGRVLLTDDNSKMKAFVFFTHNGNFVDLEIDGVPLNISCEF